MFLIPGLNVGSYITGIPFTDRQERYEMIRYPMNHADEARGWGMYVSFHLSTRPISQNAALVTLKAHRVDRAEQSRLVCAAFRSF